MELLQLSLRSRLDHQGHSAVAQTAAQAREWQWSSLAVPSVAQIHDAARSTHLYAHRLVFCFIDLFPVTCCDPHLGFQSFTEWPL